jgi:hypothetical protein
MFYCNKCDKKELGSVIKSGYRKGEINLPKYWKMRYEDLAGGTLGKVYCGDCFTLDSLPNSEELDQLTSDKNIT